MSEKSTVNRARWLLVAAIVLLALGQRLAAAHQLPVDADEPVYIWASSYYAGLMARGEWTRIPDYTYTAEHPALVKLIYAAGLRAAGYTGDPAQPPEPPSGDAWRGWRPDAPLGVLMVARYISVAFGVLQVLALAVVDPLAGALLAIHTMTSKYTAQIYLEAVPAFAITLSFLAYDRARRRGDGETGRWFWLSAALLGMAAASKYTYAVVGLAMVPFVVWQQRRKPSHIALYGALALGAFLALNPTLWPDPAGRMRDSLLFHRDYTQSAEVLRWDHPWYQPLNWMSGAGGWHPGVFWFPFDVPIFMLSLIGLPFLFRQNKLYLAWYGWGWLMLFLWPTKWPQYTLVVTPALCLSVGAAARAMVRRLDLRLDRETWERITFYLPDHTFWIKPGKSTVAITVAVLLLCLGAIIGGRVVRVLQLRDWTAYTIAEGNLPSDRISAIAVAPDDRVWVGTAASGLAVFADGEPMFLRADDSPLIDDHVTALAADARGQMWVGTESGLNVIDAAGWSAYTAADVGLDEARVRALAADPTGGMWVGTRTGLAHWDGSRWQVVASGEPVLALALDAEGRVWMGTDRGLGLLDRSGEEMTWTRYTVMNSGLSSNVIYALLADPGGMWIGTGGGGLCRFDGGDWRCYRTADSGLPWNTVVTLAQDAQGWLWMGTQMPAQAGGAAAAFDGENWLVYSSHNSGLAGGGVNAVVQDRQGRYWFGSNVGGVSVYDPVRR